MPNSKDQYVGDWQLIPELCQYQETHPPRSGQYSIKLDENDAQFDIEWIDEKDKSHKLSYGGPVDGSVNPLNGGKLEFSVTRVDSQRLDSSTYHNGFEASYVHRKTSDDGNLMVVVSVFRHDDEQSTRNFQVYKRA